MADIVFLALMVLSVGGAILALESDELVYGAIALAGSFFGVAAMFFLLDASYVAVFQITVYVGAVAILILFTVMLVRKDELKKELPFASGRAAGVLTAIAIVIALASTYVGSQLSDVIPQQNAPNFIEIGQLISTNYAPALEVLALVLAASVIGALTLAKLERGKDNR
jgi:NAD(P)H-quinone oxidoreductase subunit 6